MSEFVSLSEAAEDAGMTPHRFNAWLGRYGIRRYVRQRDLELARASAGSNGVRNDCVDKKQGHRWDQRTSEEDEITGETLVWCGRKGCGVGVVLVPPKGNDGATQVIYRHRPV